MRLLRAFLLCILIIGICSVSISLILTEGGHSVTDLLWLASIAPSSRTWNTIHRRSAIQEGGVFKRHPSTAGRDVIRFIDRIYGGGEGGGEGPQEKERYQYGSLLDADSGLGYVVERLSIHHPTSRHYGSDISTVMVNATCERCPMCMCGQFDLGDLQYSWFNPMKPIAPNFPSSFDIVVVSEALRYISWRGWPPFVQQSLPIQIFREEYTIFFDNLRRLATIAVVFYSDRDNPYMTSLLTRNGAEEIVDQRIWVMPGSAPRSPASPN